MKVKGQIRYYRSTTDNAPLPYAICATDDSAEPKPLILEVSPGAITNLDKAITDTEELANIASEEGLSCLVVRPTGRGPGSLYQNYGEIDVIEVIEDVAKNFVIDRDRISITGTSMGGAAVWYLISHYPDLFAAAAPFCGYCDYRLWEKPDGLHFHMYRWEEFSWKSRSAAFLIENLEHTPVWIVHGEWDRAIGGGVSVEHSRQMASSLESKRFPYIYTEVPCAGHSDSRTPEILAKIVPWLLSKIKLRKPKHVSLTTYSLRHNKSYWIGIEQMEHYGYKASVEAHLSEGGIEISTQNVKAFSVGSISDGRDSTIKIDGVDSGKIDLSERSILVLSQNDTWDNRNLPLHEKHHEISGPIGDLFFNGVVLVPGTAGSAEETHFNTWVAENSARMYRATNGGVHRGGIPGENWVDLPVIPDKDLSENMITSKNLVLYGNHNSNSIVARYRTKLPLRFEGNNIYLAGNNYNADKAAVFAIFPHPENPNGYLAIHAGMEPDAIAWDRFDMNLLPDFVVYARGELLDWGFWGNDWRAQ